MRTDRLLHLGCGLLALSLLLALVLAGPAMEQADRASLALGSWLQSLTLVLGAGLLVGHAVVQAVVRALTPPSFEEQVSDWFE